MWTKLNLGRATGAAITLTLLGALLSGCQEGGGTAPTSSPGLSNSIPSLEELTFKALPDHVCLRMDRAEVDGALGDEGTLHSESYDDRALSEEQVDIRASCSYSDVDEDANVAWSFSIDIAIAHYVDPDVYEWEADYEKDPYDIYPSNQPDFDETFIEADELPLPATHIVEADGWDQAAVAEFVELDDRGNRWDPDGKAISFEYLLQHENMLIETEFSLRGEGLEERPPIEPYVELLTGLADQIKSISAEASE